MFKFTKVLLVVYTTLGEAKEFEIKDAKWCKTDKQKCKEMRYVKKCPQACSRVPCKRDPEISSTENCIGHDNRSGNHFFYYSDAEKICKKANLCALDANYFTTEIKDDRKRTKRNFFYTFQDCNELCQAEPQYKLVAQKDMNAFCKNKNGNSKWARDEIIKKKKNGQECKEICTATSNCFGVTEGGKFCYMATVEVSLEEVNEIKGAKGCHARDWNGKPTAMEPTTMAPTTMKSTRRPTATIAEPQYKLVAQKDMNAFCKNKNGNPKWARDEIIKKEKNGQECKEICTATSNCFGVTERRKFCYMATVEVSLEEVNKIKGAKGCHAKNTAIL